MITKNFMMSFLPYDYQGIEKVLAEKSAEGWQLVKAGEIFWTFTKGECDEFKYEVTYVPNASEYRSEDTEHQQTLDDYCADAGWERVCNYRKIQIYRNRDLLAVPIDTDEAQKLRMMHLAVKKWQLFPAWLVIAFFVLLLLAVTVTFFKRKDPMTADVADLFLFPVIMLVSKGIEIANYYIWYLKSKKSIMSTGKCCSTKQADMIHNINMIVFGIIIIGDTLFPKGVVNQDWMEILFYVGIVMFYRLHAAWIKKLCLYIGWPTAVNRIFTFVCSLILGFYCTCLVYAMLVARGFLTGL